MFHTCKDDKEAKDLFRKLAKRLHPDSGGDSCLMILLKESYDMFLEFYKTKQNQDQEIKQKNYQEKKLYEMSYEDIYLDDERIQIIYKILKYAESHKRFNTGYVESIQEFMFEKNHITSAQFNSMVKIYYSFRMDKEENV